MIKRIRQFWRAIKAKLTVEDKVFIDKYLNDEEQNYFLPCESMTNVMY